MKTLIKTPTAKPKLGDEREVKKFLIIPQTLPIKGGDAIERRWLEYTTITQVWAEKWIQPPEMSGWYSQMWLNQSFS